MKVALIRKDYFRSRGGGERYAVNLSVGLAKAGHDVHVFAHQWESTADQQLAFHKVPIFTAFSSAKNLSFARNCQKMLSSEQFDIIHSLSQTYSQDVYRMGDGIHRHWLKIQTPVPYRRILKTMTPRQQVILYLERRTFHPSNYLMMIANSRLGKRHAITYFNVPEEKIEVIYNGVDHAHFHPGLRNAYNVLMRKNLGIPNNIPVVLFIARNFKRKGLASLIKALPLLHQRRIPAKLLVVGRGDSAPYQHLANQVDCGDSLLFVGETDQVAQYYGVGDLLALPTLYDPFSNVCLEALASGIPVVTTQENGAAEIIKPGKTGYVMSDPADCGELAGAIAPFLSLEKRESLQAEATDSVRHLTIEENTRQTIDVYQRVLLMKKEAALADS